MLRSNLLPHMGLSTRLTGLDRFLLDARGQNPLSRGA